MHNKSSMIFALVLALCFSTSLGSQKSEDEARWELLVDKIIQITTKDSSYEMSPMPETWLAANYFCKWRGMELVSIETQEKHNDVMTAFALYEDIDFWTSLNDRFIDGTFYWDTLGKIVGPFTNWAPDHPSEELFEDCVYLSDHASNRSWFTGDCDYKRVFICEKLPCTTLVN